MQARLTMFPEFLDAIRSGTPSQIGAIVIIVLICFAVPVLCAWGAIRTVFGMLQEIGVIAKDNFLTRAEAADTIDLFIANQNPFAIVYSFSEFELDAEDYLLLSAVEEFHKIIGDYEEYGAGVPVKPEAIERLQAI